MASTKPAQTSEDDGRESARQARREAIEALIDEMGTQSFPASDPPTWGSLASRLDQAKKDAGRE
jgi:hypothetical protein